jgi:signal transduction histidine kinase
MDGTKTRVLLVDPDDSFAARATRAFENLKGRAILTRTHTLAQARAHIASAPQDVVVADLHLPDGTATELVGSDSGEPNCAVVVLIRQGDEVDAAEALEAGAIDCFSKNGSDVGQLPRIALRSVREWKRIADHERAEKTIVHLRDQVHQFQRLVAGGLTARGVAQDIERLLTPILDCAQTALDKIPLRGEARGEVQRVVRAARLARALVRDVLGEGSRARTTVDVSRIVADVLDVLRPVAPAGVEIRAGHLARGAMVAGDAGQIHRIVMNLCLNAFDAMRTGGGVLQADVDVSGPTAGTSEPRVWIAVTDTGRGMNRKALDRIFDPFYTTKREGEGLGLSLVTELVKAQNGGITVESELGKGSVFHVHFPRCAAHDLTGAGIDLPDQGRASIIL